MRIVISIFLILSFGSSVSLANFGELADETRVCDLKVGWGSLVLVGNEIEIQSSLPFESRVVQEGQLCQMRLRYDDQNVKGEFKKSQYDIGFVAVTETRVIIGAFSSLRDPSSFIVECQIAEKQEPCDLTVGTIKQDLKNQMRFMN